jgi:hypothetical protein
MHGENKNIQRCKNPFFVNSVKWLIDIKKHIPTLKIICVAHGDVIQSDLDSKLKDAIRRL